MRFFPLILILLLMGCVKSGDYFTTKDGKQISYKYFEGGHNGILLIHKLDGKKEDWGSLEKYLEKEGITYLAIDLRGHGNSDGNWEDFTELDFKDMIKDVEASHHFLKTKGAKLKAIIGASIGANLAIIYGAGNDIDKLVLLSPGFNYKGLDITEHIDRYMGEMQVFSSGQDDYSYKTAMYIKKATNATVVTLSGYKHGTDMLSEINNFIINFLND